MSQRLIIESTNPNDSIIDIEEKLEKAVKSIQLQRENKQFSDVFLKQRKDESDRIVKKVIDNMFNEIEKVIQGG